MIGYATLGSNDLDRARAFYDDLFGSIGAGRLMEVGENFTLYGTEWGRPGVAVCKPYNGEAATAGNGNMIAIVMDSRDKVDAIHARALALGGTDEGAPGLRSPEGPQAFYGAYFRDPEGNKFCAFRTGPA
jgi:catechol 2,3-dioxygenase-like lactoylglutathione lyase family enzyme